MSNTTKKNTASKKKPGTAKKPTPRKATKPRKATTKGKTPNQRAAEKKRREEAAAAKKAKADARAAEKQRKAEEKAAAEQAKAEQKIQAAASSDFATYKPPVTMMVPLSSISWPTEKSGRLTRPLKKDAKYEEKVLYILANGACMTPMGVRATGKGYEGFDGQHRFYAYHEANERLRAAGKPEITEVEVRVWEISVNEALQLGFAANNNSSLMNKLEQSMAIAAWLARKENQGKTMSQAAAAFGMKLGTFRNVSSLAKLSPAFSRAVFKDRTIPASIAYVVGRLPEEEQDNWLEVAQEKGKIHDTIKRVQDRVREIKDGGETGGEAGKKAASSAASAPKPMSKAACEEMLNDLMAGDPATIGNISVTAQSVAIDVFRMVLGLKEVNSAHWAAGFQGTEACSERDEDGQVIA